MRLDFFPRLFTAALAAAAAVDAKPLARESTRHVVHEERIRPHQPQWTRWRRVPSAAVILVGIGLTQSNLHRGEDLLMDVSHPDSPNYGRHWTPKQVADMFAPKQDTIDLVMEWLEREGIGRERARLASARHWISFNATVGEVERLLRTEYHLYRHYPHNGRTHMACDRYLVPEHLAEHIDLITPTVHFDQQVAQDQWIGRAGKGAERARHTRPVPAKELQELRLRRKRAEEVRLVVSDKTRRQLAGVGLGNPSNGGGPHKGDWVDSAMMDLAQCDTMITVDCLRALYRVPPGTLASDGNTMGVVEYTPEAFLQSDLNLFFEEFGQVTDKEPIISLIDGAVVQTMNRSFALDGESSLDLEYAMALIAPQRVSLFQVGDLQQGASFNNLLAAFDASYCFFEGGNSLDPNMDGQYPFQEACGVATPTHVLSTSYGTSEHDMSPKYEQRQCAEYMKLGMQGVTVLYSSGDTGVAGPRGLCIDPATGGYTNGSTGKFNPSFPGTCPFVTSVGATEVLPGSTVESPESACMKVIFSGGGFSNVFPMPKYQKKAVAHYYEHSPPPYGAATYNNSRAVRAYPDVSANGANYVVAVDGNFTLVFGTSASAPTFGSIINLINEQRLAMGKGPVGFINPALYRHPHVMNDITIGNNPGCGTTGFQTAPGWDPVTGLGTPNYPRMLDLFLDLP